MASINSLTGAGNTSSIYGSRNIISGLASGLDTESMIENSVKGFKARITSLQQKQTILQWKQDAFRSITDKMIALTRKYTSYTSSTNLFSSSFFSKAVTTTPNGANAQFVSATGKTNSSVQIDSISQLASAAKYSAGADSLLSSAGTISASEGVDLAAALKLSNISGTMTIGYGGSKSVNIEFGELEVFDSADQLAGAIRDKLAKQTISNSEGKMIAASELIEVKVESGTITFSDKSGAGNSVTIGSVSQGMIDSLGIDTSDSKNLPSSFTVADPTKLQKSDGTLGEYLSGKEMSFTLDGVTKKIKLPTYADLPVDGDGGKAAAFANSVQEALNTAFGSGKISVDTNQSGNDLKLGFTVGQGSTLAVSSSVGEMLKLGNEATSYLSTSRTLESTGILSGLTADANGLYQFVLNGVEIGKFSKDTSLESLMLAINSNTEAGVGVSYSKMTNQFSFTTKETGAAGRIEFGAEGGTTTNDLAMKMFGAGGSASNPAAPGFKQGTDAQLKATINGSSMTLTRSTNVVDLDGLSVTLKGTFDSVNDASKAITFTTKTNSDTIVDAIKSFVEDYNALTTEIRDAYNTQPARKANGSTYLPLTDEDRTSMSESAVTAYEDKAKQGLLFADSDLSTLYNRLRTAITGSGSDGAVLRSIGLSTTYSRGLTTLTLDESKLRDALEKNPDQVKDIFTKTKEGGASTDGLMQSIKTTMDAYSSTSIAAPGILVRKAGTKLSSISLLKNTLQSSIDGLNTQIDRWQTKMSDKVDYYTRKFTALERLMSQMNAQSSYLGGMTGSY